MSVLLELPVPVVEGADLPGLQPAGDAVEVEGVVTHPPRHGALLAGRTRLFDKLLEESMLLDYDGVHIKTYSTVCFPAF